MADIASGDVTYTVLNNKRSEDGKRQVNARLQFGDGALTYPAGGIPVAKAKLGCPNTIESLMIYDDGALGYHYSYDHTNQKVRIFRTASHGHSLHLNDGDVADGATTRINAGTNLLGANTGADILVAGVAGTTGAGGIVNASAAVMTEITGVAIAAQSIKVLASGW